MNEAGYLRLMTAEPLMQNMSNQIPPELQKEAKTYQKTANMRSGGNSL